MTKPSNFKPLSMDFSGERLIPNIPELENLYQEHIIRYMFASTFVKSKIVLDAGCGTGYGPDLLAQNGAKKVVAIDNSNEAIDFCTKNYSNPKIQFNLGNCEEISFEPKTFDLITSFEVIEHLKSPEKFLAEIKRVLKTDGMFILSTPNKKTYPSGNIFHVKEYSESELKQLLTKFFSHVEILYQNYSSTMQISKYGQLNDIISFPFQNSSPKNNQNSPLYFVIICLDKKIEQISNQLFLFDKNTLLLNSYPKLQNWVKILQRDLELQQQNFLTLQSEFDERSKWAQSLDEKLKQRSEQLYKLQSEFDERSKWAQSLDKKLKQRSEQLYKLQSEFDERSKWAQSLDEKLKQRSEQLYKLQSEFDERSKWAQSLDEKLKQRSEQLYKLQSEFDERSKWAQSLDEKLKQRSEQLYKLQSEFDEHSKWAQSLDEKLKQRSEQLYKLQSEFDEHSKWAQSLDEKLKQRSEQLYKLQSEFDERSKWAQSLDEKLKQRSEQLYKLQSEFDERSKWAQSLDEKLKQRSEQLQETKSELLNTNLELNQSNFELNNIKNSFMYKQTKKITITIDKIFPFGSLQREFFRLSSASIFLIKNYGLRVFFKSFKEKISSCSINKTNAETKIRPYYLQTDLVHTPNVNIIKSDSTFLVDTNLRDFLKPVAHKLDTYLSKPLVSIIIPTLNAVDKLKQNITSIENLTNYDNFEIIVITNNLDPESSMRKYLDTLKHQILLFDGTYSFSNINNQTASHAKGEFLLFLNDDMQVISPLWLDSLIKIGLQKNVGAVGAKLLFPNKKLQEAGGIIWKNGTCWNYGRNQDPNSFKYNFVRTVDYCSAACLLVKKTIFDKIGGFSPDYLVAYGEDSDLCLSIRKLGFDVKYQPACEIIHYEGSTNGADTTQGIKSHQITNQKLLFEKWESFLKNNLEPNNSNAFFASNRTNGLNILYIDHYVPEFDKDAGSLTAFNFLSILSFMGHKITFWPENLNYSHLYSEELEQKGIEVIHGSANFVKFLEERKHLYSICILARPHISVKFIDSVKSIMPNCKIIYEASDLHFLRMIREAQINSDKKLLSLAQQSKDLELNIMQKSDFTIFRSINECEIALKEIDSIKTAAIPLPLIYESQNDTIENRKNIVFVGGFSHPPNISAVEFFIEKIFPKISKKLLDIQFLVVGSNIPKELVDLCKKHKNCVAVGYVENLAEFLDNCRVMVAPLLYGAGIKGKITFSMFNNLPVVTTTIGSEGISTNDNTLLVSDDPDEFADHVIELYTNDELWYNVSKTAKSFAEKNYSPESVRGLFEKLFAVTLNNHD